MDAAGLLSSGRPVYRVLIGNRVQYRTRGIECVVQNRRCIRGQAKSSSKQDGGQKVVHLNGRYVNH